ncbi:hypothetical protein ARMGADRAFT_447292 [Armillaria gallica]|uniref:Uncharacterized protein n=1 Tax=Armillaria gallica TaxID=47427 RepID=A0A2H3DET1_ARMGA|nr:hypothetical protein ARMGADRAFT_447292 [Armillaria gallica]
MRSGHPVTLSYRKFPKGKDHFYCYTFLAGVSSTQDYVFLSTSGARAEDNSIGMDLRYLRHIKLCIPHEQGAILPTTMSSSTMTRTDERRSHSYIEKVEVHDLRTSNSSKINMKILIAGNDVYESPIIKVESESVPIWSIGLSVGDFNTLSAIEFQLFSPRKDSPLGKLLGHAKIVISDISGRSCSSSFACVTATQLVFRYNGTPCQHHNSLVDMQLQGPLFRRSQTGYRRPCQRDHRTEETAS